MIKFRQKDFSKNNLARIIFRGKLVGKKAVNSVKSALESAGRQQAYMRNVPISSSKSIVVSNAKLTGEAAREAIKSSKNIKTKAYEAAINPGKFASDTVQYIAENPIASTTIPAGYTVLVPGTTAIGLGAEGLAKKVPLYKKATKILGEGYRKSGLPKIVEPTVNAVIETAKNL